MFVIGYLSLYFLHISLKNYDPGQKNIWNEMEKSSKTRQGNHPYLKYHSSTGVFKHFASKPPLPALFISGSLDEND